MPAEGTASPGGAEPVEAVPVASAPVAAVKRTMPLKFMIPAAAIALAAFVATGIGWFAYQNPEAPDLVSMDVERATTDLKRSGLDLGEITYDAESEEATWTVIAQSTAPGARVKRGTAVDLTLAGAPPAEVPNVTGLSRPEAESLITSATLVPGSVTEQYDSIVPAGAVISQEPVAGVSVPEGTNVALLLSMGPQPIAVPNVVGIAEANAAAALQASGFTVVSTPQDDAAAKGTVVAQNPTAGTLLVPGTAVSVAVSTGVELVKVPSWRDFRTSVPEDDWGAYLEAWIAAMESGFRKAGLVPDVQLKNAYEDESEYQNPRAGTLVPRGTTVHVEIPIYD